MPPRTPVPAVPTLPSPWPQAPAAPLGVPDAEHAAAAVGDEVPLLLGHGSAVGTQRAMNAPSAAAGNTPGPPTLPHHPGGVGVVKKTPNPLAAGTRITCC